MPKKRGPKTDVLEALLKRVDGLEAKLKEQNDGEKTPTLSTGPSNSGEPSASISGEPTAGSGSAPKRLQVDTSRTAEPGESAIYSSLPERYAA